MRTAALACLTIFSLACSSGDSGGSAAAPSNDDPMAPAGTVIEVTGQVTARSVGETSDRILANQGVVLAGDTITTGADGSVKIRLHHNQAILALAGGKTRVLRDSLAWKATKGGGDLLASANDDQTAVAGRHAEPEAADTSATALRETASATATTETLDEPAAPVAKPRRRRASKAKSSAKPPPPPKMTMSKKSSGNTELDDLLRQSAVPTDEKQRMTTSKAPASSPPKRTRKDITAGMNRLRPAFQSCGKQFPTKGVVRIKVTVAPSGKVSSVEVVSAPEAELGKCVATAVRRAKFVPASAESVFTYPVALR